MKVNDEVKQLVIRSRKKGRQPSMFNPDYYVNDLEFKFERWLYSQGYRPGDEHMLGRTVKVPSLSPQLVNQYVSHVSNEDWPQICVFASRLVNLQKLEQN